MQFASRGGLDGSPLQDGPRAAEHRREDVAGIVRDAPAGMPLASIRVTTAG